MGGTVNEMRISEVRNWRGSTGEMMVLWKCGRVWVGSWWWRGSGDWCEGKHWDVIGKEVIMRRRIELYSLCIN